MKRIRFRKNHKCSRLQHSAAKSRFVIAQENTRPCTRPQMKFLFQKLNSMKHKLEQDSFKRR